MFESAALKFISEDTLLVEYGEELDGGIFNRVLRLDDALKKSSVAKYVETLPTFRSLMIKFDVFKLSHQAMLDALSELDSSHAVHKSLTWRVPVCFQAGCAQDLSEVSNKLGINEDEIKKLLLQAPLKLYMYGFAPGFAYLGGLDVRLNIPRRDTPRSPMPEGSLMIAGGLASLSSVSMPTGWYVLGQTPLTMFSPLRKEMVPFAVGDNLQLYEVGIDKLAALRTSGNKSGIEQAVSGVL